MSDSDIESAKAVIQELHGLIKDARHAERELREGRERLRAEFASVTKGVAAGYIKVLEEHLREQVEIAMTGLEAANTNILNRAAELAQIADPQEFLAQIVLGVSANVTDVLRASIDRAAESALAHAADVVTQKQKPSERLPPAVVVSVLSPQRRNHHG